MVTAGVYLIARTNVLFELAPIVHDTAAILGGVTIVVAGLIALVQTDIKRVIAYSTMSQIGYMFVAVGLSAYGPGMFHLMTHAFFKALLFLGAGIVIHALADEQDIRKMGGLARELPRTYRYFVAGSLALAAIPPFSGFFSKDAILGAIIDAGALGWAMWVLGAAGAFLTALYTFRLLYIVFFGEPTEHVREHLHKERFEGPLSMVWPVVILAVLATFAGWLQVPAGWSLVDDWLEPAAPSIPEASGWLLAFSSLAALALAVAGIALARRIYRGGLDLPVRLRRRAPHLETTLEHKLYFDEAYDVLFYEPADRGAKALYAVVEQPFIAGSITAVAAGVRGLARGFSRLATGLVREYALLLAAGVAVIALVFISVR
jgi:NADH-quinone oxidoreductase subunit L